jgi:hypothetical protein
MRLVSGRRRACFWRFAGLAVAGVRTCFHLPAVLTTPANRASPSEVPAAPPLAIAEKQ